MTLPELEEKTRRLVTMLENLSLGAVLLNSQHNFAWLTGGSSNGIDLSRENGAASLLVTREGKRYVLANNIEMPRMLAEEVSADEFEPLDFTWQSEKSVPDTPMKLARAVAGIDKVATDIPLFADIAPIEGKISQLRSQLVPSELQRLRDLGRDAGQAMMRVIKTIEPGKSEVSIARTIQDEFRQDGMSSVVTLVAADERISLFRHPIPTVNRWKKTLLMVSCAKRFGLIVSLSRLVCVGAPSDEMRRRIEANAYVNASLLNATRPGVTAAGLYGIAAEAYRHQGFGNEIDNHHQGGAAGYKTREWVAHPENGEMVHVSQAFAWNPSITGTKVEETILTTEGGVEILTSSPGFPNIVTDLDGQNYLSPGILSI